VEIDRSHTSKDGRQAYEFKHTKGARTFDKTQGFLNHSKT